MFEELPPPPQTILTQEQKYRSNRRFAVVLNWFLLAYSALHKFVMPLLVQQFSSAKSFHFLDWWWLYHLMLALLLLRKKWDDFYLRFAMMFGLGGVVAQVIASFREYNWHIVSLWVTSAATLALILFLFSFSRCESSLWKRFGAIAIPLGFLAQYALFGFTLTVEKHHRGAHHERLLETRFPLLSDSSNCGTLGFSLIRKDHHLVLPELPLISKVSIVDCGFERTLAIFSQEGLVVENNTSNYMNVKFYAPWEGRWRSFQNAPLLAGATHRVEKEILEQHPVILVISDSDPKKGIVLLAKDKEALESLAVADGILQIDRAGIDLTRE